MKRIATLIATASATVALAGCGDNSSSSAEDALAFIPEDAVFVMSVDTDPDGEQWKNVKELLAKFPGSGMATSQFKEGVKQGSGGAIEYDRDIEPLLGNDAVLAIPDAESLQGDEPRVVGAWKVEDEDKARDLISRDSEKAGTIEDADVYSNGDGTSFTAIVDSTIVISRTREDLDAALKRQADDAGMTADGFEELTAGVDEDALLRIGIDVEAIIASTPEAAAARKVPWVAALRNQGQALSAEDDGIEYEFDVSTEEVAPEDLPLAEGEQSPAIVRRAGEIGFAIRDAAQTVHFTEDVVRLTDPDEFADYEKQKAEAAKALGIDIDRDVIDQFSGDATVSVSLTGDVAFRAALQDPEAFKATLKKAAPRLERIERGEDLGVSTPPGSGEGLYAIARPGGERLVFGVVGENFVAATDAARAGQVGGQSPSTLPDAEGALAMVLDARTVANEALTQQGQGAAAQLVTGALGDFTGTVEAETDGVSGSFKLEVK